jgi:hypothetical protein
MDVDVQGCTGKMRDFLEQNMVFLLAAGVGILVLGTDTTLLFNIKGPLRGNVPSNA